ncbi:SDR family NAD(P)-dependent oxidoreductase [Streptomyces purpurascens]|uniref:SDR family NAD(P)-dependent oxidoreductase n=1 Tax=Streptomyces purpurascens TaxID=1924 RepID=A0ABZ1MAM5_STREF|nr:SDR family NAD(P)-dependent oxidoreductase [Streptomyces purpurascens]MCE7048330.1 SDR family NAD(P)-dependent oxidoreductase [Streptomyces purpurascens]GHA25878.1 short-chain dehydrogenase [Streptomyces purpurascens]
MKPGTIVLVTGANKGIGLETARQLALLGAFVALGSRDADRGAEAAAVLARDGIRVHPVTLDVTDDESVAAAARQLERTCGRLDVLVNNAGVFIGASAAGTTAPIIRKTFEANVAGPVAMIHATLPLLRRSATPRIVNVSSATASLALTSSGADLPGDASVRLAYTSSKAALNMLTVQYAAAFRADPGLAHIKINSVSPGWTATGMNGFRAPRSVEQGARAVITLADLPDDGPSGGFYDEHGTLAW